MNKLFCVKYILGVLLFLFGSQLLASTKPSAQSTQQFQLIPGESIQTVAHYPELSYFQLGKKNQPLVVFVPGGYNLARIAYGFNHDKPQDFLAYWLHEAGFSFLALSYPLADYLNNQAYPEFDITDWAEQIVASASNTINKQQLPKTMVLLGWSMAGKVVNQVNKLAKAQGLSVIYISLSSDPSIRGLVMTSDFEALTKQPTAQGLSSVKPLVPWFLQQLHEQNLLNHHEIMSDQEYQQAILGDQPVDLLATATRYEHQHFIQDLDAVLRDTQATDYANYPMIGLIHGDSRSDYINALFTRFDWSPMLSRSLYQQIMQQMSLEQLSLEQWQGLKTIISHSPELMSREVHGNHFFFVGEQGAQQTVVAIQSILGLKEELEKINQPANLCQFTHKFQAQLGSKEPDLLFCCTNPVVKLPFDQACRV